MAVTVITTPVNISAVSTVVPLRGNRVYIEIQSFGAPEFNSNPTVWFSFAGAASANNCFQLVQGAIWTLGSQNFYNKNSSQMIICPIGALSMIPQSSTFQGVINEYVTIPN